MDRIGPSSGVDHGLVALCGCLGISAAAFDAVTLRPLLRQTVGQWTVPLAALTGSAAVLSAIGAGELTRRSLGDQGLYGLTARDLGTAALVALRWSVILAWVNSLRLGVGGTLAWTLVIGWVLPRAIPLLSNLDPTTTLTGGSHTLRGGLADMGSVLAFAVTAILLERRFVPKS